MAIKNLAAKLAATGAGAALIAAALFIAPLENDVTDPAKLAVHADPIGIPTACYGSVRPDLFIEQAFTEQECANQLVIDLTQHDAEMMHAVKVELSAPEYISYLSFHYNVGGPNFRSSTLLKLLNESKRVDACIELTHACSEKFGSCKGWIYAGDKAWPGLITRRAKERDQCLKGALSWQETSFYQH